jgi:photosystem II stability/assembly factor-like uncharacterized protein
MLTRREFTTATGAAGMALLTGRAKATAEPTWRMLPTEPYRGKQDDICFVSPDHGWYGNGAGKLFRTSDGGERWTKVAERPGTFIRALGFIDERTGFIGNVGTDYYPGVTDKQPLYRTDDGGESWTPVSAPGIERMAGVCAIDILPVDRVFQGELRRSHVIHAAGRVGGPAFVLRSRDGGVSWTVHDLSAHAGMILDIKFLDQRSGFICAATDSDTTKSQALILRTADGGESWQVAYRGNRLTENCWKMSWPSRKVGYATIQSYDQAPENTQRLVLKTTNGGRSWKELELVREAGVQEFGIGFVDEKTGWVGTRNTGLETRDGGKTWRKVEFGKAVNKLRIMRGNRMTRVFAIGTNVARIDL